MYFLVCFHRKLTASVLLGKLVKKTMRKIMYSTYRHFATKDKITGKVEVKTSSSFSESQISFMSYSWMKLLEFFL